MSTYRFDGSLLAGKKEKRAAAVDGASARAMRSVTLLGLVAVGGLTVIALLAMDLSMPCTLALGVTIVPVVLVGVVALVTFHRAGSQSRFVRHDESGFFPPRKSLTGPPYLEWRRINRISLEMKTGPWHDISVEYLDLGNISKVIFPSYWTGNLESWIASIPGDISLEASCRCHLERTRSAKKPNSHQQSNRKLGKKTRRSSR